MRKYFLVITLMFSAILCGCEYIDMDLNQWNEDTYSYMTFVPAKESNYEFNYTFSHNEPDKYIFECMITGNGGYAFNREHTKERYAEIIRYAKRANIRERCSMDDSGRQTCEDNYGKVKITFKVNDNGSFKTKEYVCDLSNDLKDLFEMMCGVGY